MRILFLLLLLFPSICYGQITKPGVQAENGGSVLGRALTVNCDDVCIVCSLSGTTLTLSFNPICSSGPPTGDYLQLNSGGHLLLNAGGALLINGH